MGLSSADDLDESGRPHLLSILYITPPFILSPTRPDAPSLWIPPPLPISVPTSSPPFLLPSASHREDRPEVTFTTSKEVKVSALGSVLDDSMAGDEIVETLQGAPVSTDTELGRHMTAFETRVRQDTDEIYTRLDDEQSQRQLLAGRLNMFFRDRRAHAYTRHQMETEARLSREAWRRSMDASDLARGEVMLLRTTVLVQMSEIRELHAADWWLYIATDEASRPCLAAHASFNHHHSFNKSLDHDFEPFDHLWTLEDCQAVIL
ncbi:hypothetical protein Tco_0603504 [Tanacetum coccineum]